jgi:hypothetical protein
MPAMATGMSTASVVLFFVINKSNTADRLAMVEIKMIMKITILLESWTLACFLISVEVVILNVIQVIITRQRLNVSHPNMILVSGFIFLISAKKYTATAKTRQMII